jgi:hypothetical protein
MSKKVLVFLILRKPEQLIDIVSTENEANKIVNLLEDTVTFFKPQYYYRNKVIDNAENLKEV